MNLPLRKPSRIAAFLMIALLVACSAATIIGYISTALQIAEAAAGISGVVPAQYIAYVAAALDGITCASIEIASSDSQAEKYLKTTACFTNAVAPTLPPGTAQNIIAMVNKLDMAIQNILANLTKPPANGVASTKPMILKDSERAKLLTMGSQAQADKIKFLAAHK